MEFYKWYTQYHSCAMTYYLNISLKETTAGVASQEQEQIWNTKETEYHCKMFVQFDVSFWDSFLTHSLRVFLIRFGTIRKFEMKKSGRSGPHISAPPTNHTHIAVALPLTSLFEFCLIGTKFAWLSAFAHDHKKSCTVKQMCSLTENRKFQGQCISQCH